MFSSMGALESRWLDMGLGEYDLSEQHMAACIGFVEENWGYGQGGNQFTCSAYLTRFGGPVLESQNPYNPASHPCLPFLKPIALVPESRWLPVKDFDLLKHTIYYYGAVYAGIHWDISGQSYRESDQTYHYSGSLPANHAILVCGWDDSKVTAGGTGAWICKNSWGTDWGDGGFFYIAYQDKKFAADEMAYYPVRWETDAVDVAYLHDELGFTAKLPAERTDQVHELAKFIAAEEQLVTHVGVAVPDPETVLDFYVYEDFNGIEPSNLLGSRENIYVEIPGIYTFELPVTVNGDFFIQVSRKVAADEANHAIETIDPGFSNPVIEPDVNWTRREGASDWLETDIEDMGLDFNLTIRAYARTGTAPVALFQSDKKEACLGSEITFAYLENRSADGWSWNFGEGASPATASTKGPHKVTYSSEGTKNISLIVSGTGGSDTVVRYDYIDVLPDIRVNILKPSLSFTQGKTAEINAYGADSYAWGPSELLDQDTGSTVMATPPSSGTYKVWVTGTQGSCTDTDTIELTTIDRPDHDDMCDAMLIEPGGWIGWWTNEYATAEEDEPAPDDTDCYGSLTWCVDDWGPTVTNSLWYTFYGPSTGVASIRTNGFDNQIAIYRADSCTEITKESLVAANDDPDQDNPGELAARLDAVTVTEGARYFLQVDGSFGGVTGAFEILFYAYPTGVENYHPASGHSDLSVFPNPGSGIFNVRLETPGASSVQFVLYNLTGQVLRNKDFSSSAGEILTRFDLTGRPAGIYHLRILDGNRILDAKLVKK
jgi:PKD repeat protein